MKVSFVIGSLAMGGAQRVCVHLVGEWVKRGWDVTLIVTYSGGGEPFYKIPGLVHLIYLANLVPEGSSGLKGRIARLRSLRTILVQDKPDIVVSFMTDANVAMMIASMGLGLRRIVSERAYPPRDKVSTLYNWLRCLTYPKADLVVFQTSRGEQWLKDEMPRAKGCVIPNPVVFPLPNLLPVLDPAALVPPTAKLMLAVGRITEQKGFPLLLSAFSGLADRYPCWNLVILGAGPDRASLQSMAAQSLCADRIQLPGPVGNLADWYYRSDLFVLPSLFEGFPNALVEAMAHGCPVVSFDCETGPGDIIRDGVDGLLVSEVGDVNALTAALERLLGDQQLRTELAKQAVGIRDRYSSESIMQMWDDSFSLAVTSAR
jgi:GalNAc-alpha-(1->4)-GalNAc-alpha-(1->3)-diNAcBac-PP-undecaprenol alpha-1,4-N-acetyl-D-galactosaminyltransferase